MTAFICTTCGVQYEESVNSPLHCKICTDERQYINPSRQTWTTLDKLNGQHKNIMELVDTDIWAIYSSPSFGIGQRAHLIINDGGNIL